MRKLDGENEKKEKKADGFKKKTEKPVWAMTREAAEENEDKEVDELLDFFENNQVSDYSQDAEIKNLLGNLKDKI